MLVTDNQQVTNIGSWVCGILEGEGCFSNDKNITVLIHNTDLDIIDACEKYLKDNFIYYNTLEKNRVGRKYMYVISISLLKNDPINYPFKFYELMQPYLQCRKDEYERILGTSTTACPLSVDKSWLTGIWEAEGCLSLTLRPNRKSYRNNCVCTIENTNKKIMDKVSLNLHKLFCGHYIKHRTRTIETWKDSWRIEISGMKRCYTFLKAMEGWWVSKRNHRRSSLMLEFITMRFQKDKNAPYSDKEFQIFQAMTDLNR